MSENVNKSQNSSLKMFLPVIAAIVGIGLLFVGNFMGKNAEKDDKSEQSAAPTEFDAQAFAKAVEKNIVDICSEISGVGHVRAVVTLGGGYRAIYVSDSQASGSSYRNQTVITGSGSSEKPLLIGYQNPEITGIGIVCSGVVDGEVKQNIISLVSAAFGISSNKIYVVGT